jgi:hypothetical protein
MQPEPKSTQSFFSLGRENIQMKSSFEKLWTEQVPTLPSHLTNFNLNDLSLADKEPGKVFFSPSPDRNLPAWLPLALWGFFMGLVIGRQTRLRQGSTGSGSSGDVKDFLGKLLR